MSENEEKTTGQSFDAYVWMVSVITSGVIALGCVALLLFLHLYVKNKNLDLHVLLPDGSYEPVVAGSLIFRLIATLALATLYACCINLWFYRKLKRKIEPHGDQVGADL